MALEDKAKVFKKIQLSNFPFKFHVAQCPQVSHRRKYLLLFVGDCQGGENVLVLLREKRLLEKCSQVFKYKSLYMFLKEYVYIHSGFPGDSMVKNPPAKQET